MKHLVSFILLLICLAILQVTNLRAASDGVRITGASVICGSSNNLLGASYTVSAAYTAVGSRILDEGFSVFSIGGGRTDRYHNLNAGSGIFSEAGFLYGSGNPGYPFDV